MNSAFRQLNAALAVLSVLTFFPAIAGAQVPAVQPAPAAPVDGVTFTGTVVAEGLGNPLPYSTVTVEELGRERFTDKAGVFTYFAVRPGRYRLRIRQLGYTPLDTTVRISRGIAQWRFTLSRVPTALAQVQVSAPPRRCIVPDGEGRVDDPELATVLGEARKNAARERLLRRAYPFEYRLAQVRLTRNVRDGTSTVRYDTTTFRSDDNWRYRKGRVVGDDRSSLFGDIRVMRLPTLGDLADRGFLTAHCFKYAGTFQQDGVPSHRIDFYPDSTLIAPDVEGSIFIDSATFLIRRAQFRLTRGGTVRPAILGMEVTTTYREILPNVALFDEIRSVQPLEISGSGARLSEFHERQQLLNFRFIRGAPPGVDGHKWIAAGTPIKLDARTRAKLAEPLPNQGPPPR